MPELPEVEITARRLNSALAGSEVESALAPGMNVMKSFEPPLDELRGRTLAGVARVGKMLVLQCGDLSLLIHLMSAGRLQLFDKRASSRDRSSRVLVRVGGRVRAATARVRDQAAGLGEVGRDRGIGRSGGDLKARARSLAGPFSGAIRSADRPATSPAPAAARPAHDRGDRAILESMRSSGKRGSRRLRKEPS